MIQFRCDWFQEDGEFAIVSLMRWTNNEHMGNGIEIGLLGFRTLISW